MHEIAGPLWQTAEATMELRMALQTQQLALESMKGDEGEGTTLRQRIAEAGKAAQGHLEELTRFGIAGKDEVAACQQAVSTYDTQLAAFLAAHGDWAKARRELKANTDTFEALGVQMEDSGDGAVEQFERGRRFRLGRRSQRRCLRSLRQRLRHAHRSEYGEL